MRLRPYRTVDDKIDGIVVSFVDISDRHRVEEALRESEQNLSQEMRLVELSRTPLCVWDFDGGILRWNRGFEELFGYSREDALGRPREALLKPTVPGSSFAKIKEQLASEGVWHGKLRQQARDGREVDIETQLELSSINGRRIVIESMRDS